MITSYSALKVAEHTHTCTHVCAHTYGASTFPGGDFDRVLTDDWESERPEAESAAAASSGHVTPETPRKDSLRGALQPRGTAVEHLQEGILDHSSEFFF